MQGGQEKKHSFVFPKKEDLIDEIKCLEDDIENVSLNLVKCEFTAVEKDVEKTFSDYTFIKIKKYNPGSFEVIFETRIDAINFIRNSFDKKIMGRRFFIKMGRQQKEHAENWAAVGFVPKSFKQAPRTFRKDRPEGDNEEHKGDNNDNYHRRQYKPEGEYKKEYPRKQYPKAELSKEDKPETNNKPVDSPKIPVISEKKPETAVKAEGKVIPKFEHKPKHTRKEGDKKPEQKTEPKAEKAKEAEKVKEVKAEQPKGKEEEKEEDDGWIVIPAKKGKGKGK